MKLISLPLLFLLVLPVVHSGQEMVNDRQITINSQADLHARRQALIAYIWGGDPFPAKKLPRLRIIGDTNPVPELAELERVDTLAVDIEGVQSYAHHFIPSYPNGRLVILHAGHFPTFDDSGEPADVDHGTRRTLEALLENGYSVLAVYMPRNAQFSTSIDVWDDGGYEAHDELFFNPEYWPATGTPFRYFLEPITAYLNYLHSHAEKDDFPAYGDFSMVGLSGGGWAATVYPAIDPRIRISISVAGSMPLYLRSFGVAGDAEQTDASFYSIAGYPDLYVMASAGAGRRQVQILNRNDWCCFSEVHHEPDRVDGLSFDDAVRDYEARVRETLISIGETELFSVEIDEAAPGHNMTWDAIYDTILPELNESRRYIATATGNEAVARANGGQPAIFLNGSWSPSKIPVIMGTPALIRGGSGTHEMFFRDTRNRLAHVTRPPLQWSRPRLLTEKIISDPAAVSRGPGEFDVIVLKSDYMLYHVRQSGSRTSINVVSEDVKGIGQPTLLASADRLDIFYRSWNRRLYHARKVGKSNWMVVDVGGRMTDLPTAVRLDDGSFRVYVRGTGGGLWESRRGPGDDDPWSSWMSVSDLLGAGPIQGSPSAVVVDGAVHVYARTPESAIRLFRFDGDWGSDIREGSYTGSPTASAEGAFSRGHQGTLNLLTQAGEIQLGGQLD